MNTMIDYITKDNTIIISHEFNKPLDSKLLINLKKFFLVIMN